MSSISDRTDRTPLGEFIAVRRHIVQALGSVEAAMVWERIRWRSERTGSWVASIAVIAEDCYLSLHKTTRALDTLRSAGWVMSTRASSVDATLRWTPDPDPEFRGHPETGKNGVTPFSKTVVDQLLVADATEREDAMPAIPEPQPPVVLDGGLFPAPPPPQEGPVLDGRLLFAAWWDAYTETHGHEPDGMVNGPLAGAVRAVVKTRTTDDSWRDAWRAFRACGHRGQPDTASIRRELLKTESAYKREPQNHGVASLQRQAADGTIEQNGVVRQLNRMLGYDQGPGELTP